MLHETNCAAERVIPAQLAAGLSDHNCSIMHAVQDSLSGGSKALMIVNVNPEEASIGETLCSLKFAARVRGIELGPAKRKLESGSQLGQLRHQISSLQAQVLVWNKETGNQQWGSACTLTSSRAVRT